MGGAVALASPCCDWARFSTEFAAAPAGGICAQIRGYVTDILIPTLITGAPAAPPLPT